MTSGLRGLLQSLRPAISRTAQRARRQLGRVDNAEIRQARRLARVTRKGDLDVVYLGDSTVSWVAPDDLDRRKVDAMLREALSARAPGLRMHATHGGSYNPRLYSALLRMVHVADGRPCIVVPLCVRVRTIPWMEHPAFGHQIAADLLLDMPTDVPLRRIRKGIEPPTASDFEHFYTLPHPTWSGGETVGDHVLPLKSGELAEDEYVKLLYAYHHGGRVHEGKATDTVRQLGADLRALGVPVVVYQTPIPHAMGNEIHGRGFRELAQENLATMDAAFREGFGPIDILQTGLDFDTEEFLDWRMADEHLNEHGRRRLAEMLADAVVAQVKEPVR